jgi:hypothetical protein
MEPRKMENDMFYINAKFLRRLRQASRWLVLLLLACLAGGVAQAQKVSFTPGMVSALTSTDSTTGSSDPNYIGPLSGLFVSQAEGLTYDSQGDLFIVDAGANVVRVVASGNGPIPSLPSVANPVAGTVYTVAGSGSNTPSSTQLCSSDQQSTFDSNYYGNGCPANDAVLFFLTKAVSSGTTLTAGQQYTAPLGQVALDANGNLYIADVGDHQVRVVYAAGTVPGLVDKLPSGVTAPVPGNIYAFAGSPINQQYKSNQKTNKNPDGSLNMAPVGVAVDASGDVYILLYLRNPTLYQSYQLTGLAVVYNGGTLPPILAGQTLTTGQYTYDLLPLNYQTSSGGSGVPPWYVPVSITVDSSGNIYIGDSSYGSYTVPTEYVIYAGGTVPGLSDALIAQGVSSPVVGNAYTFSGAGSVTPAYATTVLASNASLNISGKGPANPSQIGIDSVGNLYMGIFTGGASGLNNNGWDGYLAKVDPSGNLALFAGNTNHASTGIQAVCAAAKDDFGDGCPANLVGILGPMGVAVAPDGSIEYADDYTDPTTGQFIASALHKIDGSASELDFSSQTAGVASAAQVVTISNVDAQPLNISSITIPNNFTQVASGGTDCTASTTLTTGQSCLVGVEFQAVQDGTYSGNVEITSDSTNAASGVNSIAVSGTATATTGTSAQTITFTAPSTATYGQAITLNGTASSGLTVLYEVSGPGKLQGNKLTVTGTSAITVTAYQPGDNGDSGNSAGWAKATPVSVTITAQAATLTVTANNFDQTPGLAIPTLTYTITGFVNGDTQATATTGAPDISTTATASSSPGTYPITITQGTLKTTANNYSLTFVNGTFTIDARLTQTITFTQSLPTMTYGVSPITLTATASSGLAVTYTVTGPATITGSFLTITGAGAVGVTATQPGNVTYAAAESVTQSFLVNAAPLTFTADNLTMAAGSPVPTLTYTVSGFVNGDNAASVVSGTPTIGTSATSSSPVGTYPITIAQGSVTVSSHYTVSSSSFVSGTMSVVTGTSQTITFAALPNATYGVAPMTLSATASSGLSVTYTVTSGSASIANNVLTVTGAGTVTVTATQVGNATYSPAKSVSQSMTVAQAQLTITADNKTRVNNTANPSLTYTTTGFVNGDTSAVVSGSPNISTTATSSSPPGDYSITVASFTDSNGNPVPSATNYTISYVSGTLTITSGGPAQSFTLALSQQNLTILDGQIGQVTLSVTPVNYYEGVLNLSCKGLPANVSCVFSPASLSVPSSSSSSNPAKGTLSISTSNASVVSSLKTRNTIYSAAIAGWTSLLFGVILAWQRKRLARYKTLWMLAMVVCLGGMAASLTACGGSSSSTSSGLAAPGTSTIQVVATDSNGSPSNSIDLVITIH